MEGAPQAIVEDELDFGIGAVYLNNSQADVQVARVTDSGQVELRMPGLVKLGHQRGRGGATAGSAVRVTRHTCEGRQTARALLECSVHCKTPSESFLRANG
eukprot:8663431-Lingulodinium_polyedra.AAC.1